MKITAFKVFLYSMLALFCTAWGTVCAQESGSPSFELYETELFTPAEKNLSTPGESVDPIKPNTNPATPVKNDSSSVRYPSQSLPKSAPIVKQPVEESQESEEDDSILSFNFLYYLIERYKLQDIVD